MIRLDAVGLEPRGTCCRGGGQTSFLSLSEKSSSHPRWRQLRSCQFNCSNLVLLELILLWLKDQRFKFSTQGASIPFCWLCQKGWPKIWRNLVPCHSLKQNVARVLTLPWSVLWHGMEMACWQPWGMTRKWSCGLFPKTPSVWLIAGTIIIQALSTNINHPEIDLQLLLFLFSDFVWHIRKNPKKLTGVAFAKDGEESLVLFSDKVPHCHSS